MAHDGTRFRQIASFVALRKSQRESLPFCLRPGFNRAAGSEGKGFKRQQVAEDNMTLDSELVASQTRVSHKAEKVQNEDVS